jgi:hypothetical protein
MMDYDHRVIEQWMAANGWTLDRENVVLPWAGPEPAANGWFRHNPHGPNSYEQVPIRRTLGDYQRRLEQLVETLHHIHGIPCKTAAEQAYERMQRPVEGAVPTNDERMQSIRERAATWRQMGDGGDGPIAIALYLLEQLNAHRAVIAAENAKLTTTIDLLRAKANELRRSGDDDNLCASCDIAAEHFSARLLRVNGEVVR